MRSNYTPSAVRQAYNSNPDAGHFFDRATLQWFGDTMRSFGTTRIDNAEYLYRKRTASVSVFGTRKTAGREYFNAWRIVETGGRLDLDSCSDEETEKVYTQLYR